MAGRCPGTGRSHFQKDPALEADLPDSGTSIVSEDTLVYAEPPMKLVAKAPSGETVVVERNEPSKRRATFCPFMNSPLLSMLMFGCENLSAPPGGTVEVDLEYDGQPAAALTYLEEGENPVAFYVHRESLLPLAWVIEYGEPGNRSEWVTSYENDFLPMDSLPPDFLDAALNWLCGARPIGPAG